MRNLAVIVVTAMRAGAMIACTVIAAEVVRDVATRGCDVYRDTHPVTAPRRTSAAK